MEPSQDDESQKPLAQNLRGVEAEYRLEYPVKCPNCAETLQVLVAIRLLRTAVNFTSTLPRRGRVIACPLCRGIVSAELAGFA